MKVILKDKIYEMDRKQFCGLLDIAKRSVIFMWIVIHKAPPLNKRHSRRTISFGDPFNLCFSCINVIHNSFITIFASANFIYC